MKFQNIKFQKTKLFSVFAVAAISVVHASPATDLYREAAFYLEQYYHGYSTVNIKDIIAKYQSLLDERCKLRAEQCPFEEAKPFVQGLMSALNDRHSFYLSKESFAAYWNEFRGNNINPRPLSGLRFLRFATNRTPMIEDVLGESAAAKAGVQAFDRVVAINGQNLPGQNLNENLQWLQQKLDTDLTVRLSLERGPTDKPKKVLARFKRSYLPDTNLPSLYEPPSLAGFYVLRIPSFVGSNTIAPRVHGLVQLAQSKNARAIVVDVRGNPGGEETECLAAANAFLGDVELIDEARLYKQNIGMKAGRVTGNDPRDPSTFFIADPVLWQGPMAVLTNSRTASCGELFSYLIQRAKRGPVVGEATAGVLNTATEFFQLIDQSALAITYVRAQNLDGTPLPERVLPDSPFVYDPQSIGQTGHDAQLEKAAELLNLK